MALAVIRPSGTPTVEGALAPTTVESPVAGPLRGWAWIAFGLLARGYRAFLLTLVAIATLPALVGWSSFAVSTGSMEPAIAPGDVVVGMPYAADDPRPVLGRVMVFRDPSAEGGRLLVHRVVEEREDGLFTTAGDANAVTDSTPVPPEALQARAVVLVPGIGLPIVWARTGDLVPLTLWLVLSVALLLRAGCADDGPRTRRPGRLVATVALVTASGIALGTTQVQADAGFTARSTTGSNAWTAGAWMQPYVASTMSSSPYALYLMDEDSGELMNDRSTNGRTGSYFGITDFLRPGALAHNPGTGVALNGLTDRLLSGGAAVNNPTTFSVELWFRTTTREGGKLFGFESSRNVISLLFDRQLFMRPDGRLVYGQWPSTRVRTLVSPRALNDGAWHHLVLTVRPSGNDNQAAMYVDGTRVASGPATRPGAFSGWWRFGFGSIGLGEEYPSAGFVGHLDNAAIYHSELSAAEVARHYAAR